MRRFSGAVRLAKYGSFSPEGRTLAEYLRALEANAIRPPVNTSGRGPWVVMYQGETADQLRALAASLLIAADAIEDAPPKEHCPIRMAYPLAEIPKHQPCDTGDHSRDHVHAGDGPRDPSVAPRDDREGATDRRRL